MSTAAPGGRVLPTEIARGGSRPGWRLPAAAAAALAVACLPISVLFTDSGWVMTALITIGTVCGTGALLRGLPVPLAVVPVAQTAAFAAVLAWTQSGGPAGLSRPWDSLLAYRELVLDGVLAVQHSAAPAEATPALLALLAVLVFLAALLVETLAVGLGMAGLSGAVLLIMAAVPLGIRPQGPLLVLLAGPAIAWLLLLAADHSARMNALPAAGDGGRGEPARQWLALAGLCAAGIATTGLVLSAAAPSATESPWLRSWWNALPGQQGSGSGSIDPLVDVRSRLVAGSTRELLRYQSSDAGATYLRLVTLESFDGAAWSPYPPTPGVGLDQPAPDLRPGSAGVPAGPTVDILISALDNRYLPVPDGVASVALSPGAPGDWAWDRRTGDVVGTTAPATGVAYRAVVSGASPAAGALADAGSDSLRAPRATRELPASVPADVAAMAAEATEGAASNFESALALQRWFTGSGGFEYSLNVPDAGARDPLSAFLQDRVGFCQQYATAMAVMSRALGIPARVVVGFTGGTAQPDGTFVVTGANAHAWPELWFDGPGWVRFEPTPASGASAVVPPAYTPDEPEPPQGPSPAPAPSIDAAVPPVAPAADAAPGVGGALWQVARWGAILAILAGIAAFPAVLRRRLRVGRMRSAAGGDVLAAWEEVAATAVDAGIAWPRRGTLRQQAAALTDVLGDEAEEAVWRLVAAAEMRRYAPAGQMAHSPIGASALIADEPAVGVAGGAAEAAAITIAALDQLPRTWVRCLLPRSIGVVRKD